MKRVLLFVGVFSLSMQLFSQQRIPVSLSVGSEATALPFTTLPLSPMHPMIQVSTEVASKQHKIRRRYQTLELGYMHHQNLFQGMYLRTDWAHDWQLSSRFYATGSIGMGYLHTFVTREEYALKDGKYEIAPDRGNSRLMPGIAVGSGYVLSGKEGAPEIFARYRAWLEYPYSPGFIPVMTHSNLVFGLKIYLNKKQDA